MTVRDLIAKLAELPQDVPVCLADWNEGYREPSEEAAEKVTTLVANYYDASGLKHSQFVCIG